MKREEQEAKTTTATETAVLSDGSERGFSSDGSPTPYDKAEIERLGRERPSRFANLYSEIGFVVTVIMSMCMSEFFISGFSIALPGVEKALNMSDSARTWPNGVINLTTAALLMPFARACDIYGCRTVFLAGHTWLLLWSVVCGFSKNTIMLIMCRAMQGLGTAAFMPASVGLLGQIYRPGPRKNIVFAIWGASASIGFYCGIFIGAVCSQFLTWRWYFWLGAIIVALVVAGGSWFIPTGLHKRDDSIKMDWWGFFTIVPGLVLVVFAFTDGASAPDGWKTPYIYVTLILGVLFLAAAVYVEGWVSKQPLMPPELFKPKGMKRLSLGLFFAYGVFGLYMFYASYYIETVLNASPILAAAWFTPLPVGGIILSIGGGFVLHLIPNRGLMILSSIGFAIAVLLFAIMPNQVDGHPSTSFLYWSHIFAAMICATIGVDITFNTTSVFITTKLPARLQATAGGLIESLFFLALSFWLGISEMVISQRKRSEGDHPLDLRHQYQTGFWIGLALAGLALILVSTVSMGQASAELTFDEKEELSRELAARENAT